MVLSWLLELNRSIMNKDAKCGGGEIMKLEKVLALAGSAWAGEWAV